MDLAHPQGRWRHVADDVVPVGIALAALTALTLLALTAGAWYARRRWSR